MFRQRGATFLGMVIIIAIMGSGLYGAIRLVPLYFEYMAVVRAMEQTAKEEGSESSVPALRLALEKRWEIEDIMSIQPKEILITKSPTGYLMRAEYRAEAPFVSNISLVVDFDKTVPVSGSAMP